MDVSSPEIMAWVEAQRKEYRAEVAGVWRKELKAKDWLLDGHPIRAKWAFAMFDNLDWEKAWLDLGPSIAGNPGPYWHVPLKESAGDTVHRLYPKILLSRWGMLILHACFEAQAKAVGQTGG